MEKEEEEAVIRKLGHCLVKEINKGNGQKYCTQTGPTIPQKDRWSLHVPPSPTFGEDGVLFV